MGTSEKKFARRFMSLSLIQRRGEVRIYKAVHAFRGVEVFLKIARKAATDTQIEARSEAQRKLHLEALATDRVVHPNVVRVIDAGLGPKHETFVATEYLHGQDLADRIDKRGRISVPKALSVGIAVARALCVAHKKGVIHGDIKPSNIFLLSEECEDDLGVKLLDFGCAFAPDLTGLRAERKASGTPGYMCPAYSATGILNERSDIFSLGVTLYEALSVVNPLGTEGRFEISDSSLMLRERKRKHATPLCALVPTVPHDLSLIIDRAIAHDPARRFGSARELLRALEGAREKLHYWAGPGSGYGVGDDSPTAPFGLPTALRALDLMTASREAIVGLASGRPDSLEPATPVLAAQPLGLHEEKGALGSYSLELDRDAAVDPACDFRPTPFGGAARRICAPLDLDLDEAGDLPTDAAQASPPSAKQARPAPASTELQVSLPQAGPPPSDDVTPVVGVPCPAPCVSAALRDSAAPAAEQTGIDSHAIPPSGVSAPMPPPNAHARDAATVGSALADDLDAGWATPSPEHESKAPPTAQVAPLSKPPVVQAVPVAALDPAVAIREALACEDSTPPSCSAIVRALDAETPPEGIHQAEKGSEARPSQAPAIGLVVAGDTDGGLFVRAVAALPAGLPWFGRQGWLEACSTATGAALWALHRPDAFAPTSDPAPASRPTTEPSRMLTLWSPASSALLPRTHLPAAVGTIVQSAVSPAVQTLSCGTMARRSTVFHAPVRTAELLAPDTTPFGTFAALPLYVGRHAQTAVALVQAPAPINIPAKAPESGKVAVARVSRASGPHRSDPSALQRPAIRLVKPDESIKAPRVADSSVRACDARTYGGVPIRRPPASLVPFEQILRTHEQNRIRLIGVGAAVGLAAAVLIGLSPMYKSPFPTVEAIPTPGTPAAFISGTPSAPATGPVAIEAPSAVEEPKPTFSGAMSPMELQTAGTATPEAAAQQAIPPPVPHSSSNASRAGRGQTVLPQAPRPAAPAAHDMFGGVPACSRGQAGPGCTPKTSSRHPVLQRTTGPTSGDFDIINPWDSTRSGVPSDGTPSVNTAGKRRGI